MEIKNFVKIYDEVLPWNVLSNLIRFSNISKFEETKIGGGENIKVDFNIRRTYGLVLSNLHNSFSNVHWFNLLYFYFNKNLKQYKFDVNILDYNYQNIFDIEILKYENTGFYTWHVDHFCNNPKNNELYIIIK